jgi:hypothetical protein
MKPVIIGMAALGLLVSSTLGMAQSTQGSGSPGSAPTMSPTGAPSAGAASNAGAASGNNNQAVVTTSANAPSPAQGANSFTVGEAKSRIEKGGFSNVSDLAKDDHGVWHGKAQKDGSTTSVWLDYKGNVGASK